MGNISLSEIDLAEQWNRWEAFFSSKKSIGVIVVIMGSIYPMILKLVKGGEETTREYPFMIGVAICIKNIIMLCYYSVRILKYHYSQQLENVNLKIKNRFKKGKNKSNRQSNRDKQRQKIKYHRISDKENFNDSNVQLDDIEMDDLASIDIEDAEMNNYQNNSTHTNNINNKKTQRNNNNNKKASKKPSKMKHFNAAGMNQVKNSNNLGKNSNVRGNNSDEKSKETNEYKSGGNYPCTKDKSTANKNIGASGHIEESQSSQLPNIEVTRTNQTDSTSNFDAITDDLNTVDTGMFLLALVCLFVCFFYQFACAKLLNFNFLLSFVCLCLYFS